MRAFFYVGDPHWSGSARVFLAAAHGLAGRGHQVAIGCADGTLLQRRSLSAQIETLNIGAASTDEEGRLVAPADLKKALRERQIDAVFVCAERDQLVVGAAARGTRGSAAIPIIRRVPAFEADASQRASRPASKTASAGLMFTTEQEAQRTGALGAGWSIPTAIAPLGVDVAAYDPIAGMSRAELGVPPHALLVACAYEPSGRHRVATLMRTLALLAPRHPDLHAIIIGPGALDEDLPLHAAALGVTDIVTFLGERLDDLSVLRAADIGWVVAEADGGALGCMDFMAFRIPVLANRSSVAQHYVADGISGVLLAAGEPPATASAVAAFLAHEDRRVAMGNAGRTRVQRDFPEMAMIDGFERALQVAADRQQWKTK